MFPFLDESSMRNQVAAVRSPVPIRRRRFAQRPTVQQQQQQQLERIYNQGVPHLLDQRFNLPWQPRVERQTPDMTEEGVPSAVEHRMGAPNNEVVANRDTIPLVVEPLIDERACPWRRCVHTLPRLGVDEHVTQPLLYLALEALRIQQQALDGMWDSYRVGSLGQAPDPIVSPSQFVAEYMEQHMTPEVFNAGNRPRYGSSPETRTPPPSPRNT
ncbi:uncharacterized protein LOC108046884 isoform X2 [Drosophila rhopaloa]|uniref:Uncharacterized protein LOC108046884 isoform X2 n=1 Tax=Drosophila rhopaloa TaxID=1041015 RepID=A0A6P4EVV4_DRORH|nr:uncharacterized protein LOC108046884 isoform X2 [Drosophila rhopaloa]